MVNAEDVIEIYRTLAHNGIPLWLTGGWGIDALLGEQTRPHKDLDVLLLLDDVGPGRELLDQLGYSFKELWSENRWAIDERGNRTATAFVLQDADGREFDAHAIRLDEQGNGIAAWAVDECVIDAQDLAAQGTVGGTIVRCISAELQARFHTGYDLPEAHVRDVENLRRRLRIEVPPAYPEDDRPEA